MTDRELLEAAATAADFIVNFRVLPSAPYELIPIINDRCWNPLIDDGDAFRLAVQLDIRLKQQFAMVMAEYPWIDDDFNTRKILCESVLDDHCASSRRAIVRAAAEIGKRVGAPQSAG